MPQKITSSNEMEMQVFAMFQQNLDAKEIAKSLDFADHRQMANYMKSRGYIWNSRKKNYELVSEESLSDSRKDTAQPNNISDIEISCEDSVMEIMTFLKAHKEALMEIFNTHSPITQMPRYVVPGVYTTKSVYMNHNFDLLARQFSEEKNISQRNIFEIALIDFFKKYGYHDKVKMLIGPAAPILKMVVVFAIFTMF
jgi:hypothetical protein